MKFVFVFALILVAGATIIDADADVKGCICPALYRPVCATNGKTYDNSCSMKCDGATLAHDRECHKGK